MPINVTMWMAYPSAIRINIPAEQHPQRTMPMPNINAPIIRGILIVDTPSIFSVPSDKYFIIVIPREAVKIPINIPLNCSVDPVIKGSVVAETKHSLERCNIIPKLSPKIQYHMKLLPCL